MILNKPELVIGCRSIIETLCMLVDHYGESFKLPVNDKKEKERLEQHLKFLGSVGLVDEFKSENNLINVTVSPHILGFCVEFIKEIELITDLTVDMDIDKCFKAFSKMFPQDRDHCDACCPYEDE